MAELCRNGHEMTEENTYTHPDGHSRCRECHRAANRRYNRTHKARARSRRYFSTPQGRAAMRRGAARYRRTVKGVLTEVRKNAKKRGNR